MNATTATLDRPSTPTRERTAAAGRPESTAPKLTLRLRPRHALWGAGFLLTAGALVWSESYWTVGRFIESTDDAYVKADSTMVAPKVSGYIGQVLIDDNQTVRKGQILAVLDERDLQTALREAGASVAAR